MLRKLSSLHERLPLSTLANKLLEATKDEDARSRAICSSCAGRGTWASYAHIYGWPKDPADPQGERDPNAPACVTCAELRRIHQGDGPYCGFHICHACSGTGIMCPYCRGRRYQRAIDPVGCRAIPCPGCQIQVPEHQDGKKIEKWQYSLQTELHTFDRYLAFLQEKKQTA